MVAKPPPIPSRSVSQTAEPVVYQPHLNALLCLFDQFVGEKRPLLVVVDDVRLEQNKLLRRLDRFKPCRIILGRVDKKAHVVPMDQPCPGHPFERFIDEAPVQNRQVDLGRKHEIGGQALLKKVWG